VTYEEFVRRDGARLRAGLVAAYGPEFEPALASALESLTEPQRVGVVLVHALGWTQREAAQLLDVDISTLRTHIARAFARAIMG
jgi:DNA-directed RNA polymerase specialized sigma24 family protein